MEEKNLDFSVQSFWFACIAPVFAYVICKSGIMILTDQMDVYLLGFILGIVAFLGYLWFRRSRITSDVKLDGTDIFTAVISSSFVQVLGAILMLFFGTATHAVPTPTKENNQDVYYENCTDAWEQGATPVYSDDPGYSIDLDRDEDGVGCE